ncbi:hypothetical protein [Leptospira interrogans]|uniref:hypothetical protein n=1 Tax=Leptospira interrogans TaxID=173 RepID=UPI0002BBA96C|nr:hypothetical protein [Leptospira interrogans]EMN93829.1 hypothetical protein LEP1GSC110_0366 [Leptospira interrogans serovar Medanensis str. UT053]EMN99624.1 hypothetical protein LEP1GSC112_3096 [Leptospira interrogans serovar Pomona str. UT364]
MLSNAIEMKDKIVNELGFTGLREFARENDLNFQEVYETFYGNSIYQNVLLTLQKNGIRYEFPRRKK